MGCKTTYFKSWRPGRRSGFTLTEMLFAMGITALMAAAVCAFSVYSSRNFVAISNYVDLDNANRLAMDRMISDIRQANCVMNAATNYVLLSFPDAINESRSNRVAYRYSPSLGTLVRTETNYLNVAIGTPQVLLTGCDRLEFKLGQRNLNTNGIPYIGLPLNSPQSVIQNTAKVIDVSWLCSRRIFGLKVNTESVQTARVVIRKQTD